MAKKALITGATGLLGRQVLETFKLGGWDAIGTGYSRSGAEIRKLDINDKAAVLALLNKEK
jgi:S-adenosylmethionine synthetase